MTSRSSSTPAATNPTARQRRWLPHCAMATSSSKEPADNSTSPAGTCASTSRTRPGRKVIDRRRRPSRRATVAAPSATSRPNPVSTCIITTSDPSPRPSATSVSSTRGQIAVSGRLPVDNTRIRRPREPGGSATVVPDDPFAGGRGRERGPRTVGPEHHVGPASLGGPHRGRCGGVSVDDLKTYSGTVGPESKGARPCFPESGQRPRQRGDQDGARCHAHNIGESNNCPPPRLPGLISQSHLGLTPLVKGRGLACSIRVSELGNLQHRVCFTTTLNYLVSGRRLS